MEKQRLCYYFFAHFDSPRDCGRRNSYESRWQCQPLQYSVRSCKVHCIVRLLFPSHSLLLPSACKIVRLIDVRGSLKWHHSPEKHPQFLKSKVELNASNIPHHNRLFNFTSSNTIQQNTSAFGWCVCFNSLFHTTPPFYPNSLQVVWRSCPAQGNSARALLSFSPSFFSSFLPSILANHVVVLWCLVDFFTESWLRVSMHRYSKFVPAAS